MTDTDTPPPKFDTFSEVFSTERDWAQIKDRTKGFDLAGKDEKATCIGLAHYKLKKAPFESSFPVARVLGFSFLEELFRWNDKPERKFSEIQEACTKLDAHFFPHNHDIR